MASQYTQQHLQNDQSKIYKKEAVNAGDYLARNLQTRSEWQMNA